jgi:alanine racemase
LTPEEVGRLLADTHRYRELDIDLLVSHLACADDPDHVLNRQQLEVFAVIWQKLHAVGIGRRATLANSSGVFLGSEFHFDLARPGAALYGINPVPGRANPMRQVVRLQAKIRQVRVIDRPKTVGYGATYKATAPTRIGTVGVGYADGYLRSLSNRGVGFVQNYKVPIVGRVSMDLLTIDLSGVPEALAQPGELVDLIGPNNPVDDVAARAGTIGYEVLTSLGARYKYSYVGG